MIARRAPGQKGRRAAAAKLVARISTNAIYDRNVSQGDMILSG